MTNTPRPEELPPIPAKEEPRPKNIVLCLDGTHNQISGVNTDVWRLYAALERDEAQLTYYDPGVGTLKDASALTWHRKMVRWVLDLAAAHSLRDNFIEAYAFIARHYNPGDRIFIFGFSRGAYTARAVAGAIHLFGLIRPENENLIAYLWQTYSDDSQGATEAGQKLLFETARKFKAACCSSEVNVSFLGVWDTVSAFGFITQFRTLAHTRNNPSIEVVRHAAAIDEKRSLFGLNQFKHDVEGQDFREVWFAGYHSDVGGGAPANENGLGLISLDWMIREAVKNGMRINSEKQSELDPNSSKPVWHNSMGFPMSLLEFLPVRKWNNDTKSYAIKAPNLFKPRPIPEGALIHHTVFDFETSQNYNPKNLPKAYTQEP